MKMKKYLLAIASLLTSTVVSAQMIGGYKATTSQDVAYKEAVTISDSVVQGYLYLSDSIASKSVEGKGFPIGFDFPFNGSVFKYFGVSAQGLIKLSETDSVKMEVDNSFINSSKEGGNNTIFCYDQYAMSYDKGETEGCDPTSISYKSNGDELVVEWKDLGINTSSWKKQLVGTYTLQIHLFKDGRVKYVLNGLSGLESTSAGNVTLGMRGGVQDYITWDSFDATNSYYATNKSFKLSALAEGHTISVNTPGEIVAPEVQPTNIKTEVNYKDRVYATVTFDEAAGVDNYLMLVSKGAPTKAPANDSTYAKGDSIGNAAVILAGKAGIWGTTADNLDHNTDYTITVYAYNSYGTGSPKYNPTAPLQTSFTTAPEKPGTLKVLSASKNSLKLNVAANSGDDMVMVVYNDSVYNPELAGNRAYAGTPDKSLKAGDYLTYSDGDTKDEKAGKVAYFGKAGDFELTGLDASTSYYFIAYSYNETTETFSQGADTAQVWTSTDITVPYAMDLTGAPVYQLPGGWTAGNGEYNYGFRIITKDDREIKSQTEGNNVIYCDNGDKKTTFSIVSPTIELTSNNKVSVDWLINQMGSGWFATAAAYEEWDEGDSLAFVLYADGEKVVLKKYTSGNAPKDEDADSWHPESFDLSLYAGKNVQFGVEWLGACNSTLRLYLENIKVTGDSPTGIASAKSASQTNDEKTFNLNGQRVSDTVRGLVIKNGKKVIVR